MTRLLMFIAAIIMKIANDESFNHGHVWYFDDPHFLQDVYLTICGEIDRASIPPRRKMGDGGLALRT